MYVYRDRSWCSRAKECKHTPCNRRLTDEDLVVVRDMDMLITYDKFMDCIDYKIKDKK